MRWACPFTFPARGKRFRVTITMIKLKKSGILEIGLLSLCSSEGQITSLCSSALDGSRHTRALRKCSNDHSFHIIVDIFIPDNNLASDPEYSNEIRLP